MSTATVSECVKKGRVSGYRHPFFSAGHRPTGLYDPKYEYDACGVGCITDIQGRAYTKIVRDANKLLTRMTHRGASQRDDGDGAGIMLGIAHRFFVKLSWDGQLPFMLPRLGRYGVFMIFLPNGEHNAQSRGVLMDRIERVVRGLGLSVLGWRSPVPTKSSILGPIALATEPFTVQLFVCRPCDNEDAQSTLRRSSGTEYDLVPLGEEGHDTMSSFDAFDFSLDRTHGDLERLLYLARRRLAKYTDMYICSASSRVIVYKGQLQSQQLFYYYDDLMDEDFASYLVIVHSRFSTNTFPTWDRAHPFRRIAHNGEINTIAANRRWLQAREAAASLPANPMSRHLKNLVMSHDLLSPTHSRSRRRTTRRWWRRPLVARHWDR